MIDKKELLKLFYIDNNFQKIINLCIATEDKYEKYYLAKAYMETGKYFEAGLIFKDIKMPYALGYTKLLEGKKDEAKNTWLQMEEISTIRNWGLSLISIIDGEMNIYPTYFQIRNYLEQDLTALIKSNQTEYVKKIIQSYEFLSQINSEVFKYFANILYNNGYYKEAKIFLNKGKDIFYNDPEIHFIEGRILMLENNKPASIKAFNTALSICKDYYPAKKILSEIT